MVWSRDYLDVLDRAAILVGLITAAFCVFYTGGHMETSLFAVAVWWGPIIGLFAALHAFIRLKERCKRYERLLREHNIDLMSEVQRFDSD